MFRNIQYLRMGVRQVLQFKSRRNQLRRQRRSIGDMAIGPVRKLPSRRPSESAAEDRRRRSAENFALQLEQAQNRRGIGEEIANPPVLVTAVGRKLPAPLGKIA